ncbi:hypothetical protein JXQ31_06675 [candidate division KSB1 bacterium]|nr:hypothetical protein [candidate division KSB1 bacterium]
MTDVALKKDFFGRFLSTTLQVRDIFGQAGMNTLHRVLIITVTAGLPVNPQSLC